MMPRNLGMKVAQEKFFQPRVENPTYTKPIPVATVTDENLELMVMVRDWHTHQLASISPKDRVRAPAIPRHEQIINDINKQLLKQAV